MMGLIKVAFHQNRRIFAPENQSFLRGVDLPEILEETPTLFAGICHATLWNLLLHLHECFMLRCGVFFAPCHFLSYYVVDFFWRNHFAAAQPMYDMRLSKIFVWRKWNPYAAIGGPSCTQAGHKQTERDKMSKDTNDINLPVVKFPGTFPEPSFRQPWTWNTNMWRSRLQFDVFHR